MLFKFPEFTADGLFRPYLFLQISAAMSATLLFAALTMMVGAVSFCVEVYVIFKM